MKVNFGKRVLSIITAIALGVLVLPTFYVKASDIDFAVTVSNNGVRGDITYIVSQNTKGLITQSPQNQDWAENAIINDEEKTKITVTVGNPKPGNKIKEETSIEAKGWTKNEGNVFYKEIAQGESSFELDVDDFFEEDAESITLDIKGVGTGKVSVGEDDYTSDAEFTLSGSKDLIIEPEKGSYVSAIKINGVEKNINDVTKDSNSYKITYASYTSGGNGANKNRIDVTFGKVSVPGTYTTDLHSVFGVADSDYFVVGKKVYINGNVSELVVNSSKKISKDYSFINQSLAVNQVNISDVIYIYDPNATNLNDLIKAYKLDLLKDVTGPEIKANTEMTKELESECWIKESTNICAYIRDDVIGIDKVVYRMGEATFDNNWDENSCNIGVNGKVELPVNIDDIDENTGTKCTIYAIDKLGNISSKEVNIKKDETAPEVNINIEKDHGGIFRGGWFCINEQKKARVSMTDTQSGYGNIEVKVKGRIQRPENGKEFVEIDGLSDEEINEIEVTAEDKAGNKITLNYEAILDKKAPTIEISNFDSSKYYKQNGTENIFFVKNPAIVDGKLTGTIGVTISDQDSKINKIKVGDITKYEMGDNEDLLTSVELTDDKAIDLDSATDNGDGTYSISVIARDNAGNEKCSNLLFVTDNAKPVIDGNVQNTVDEKDFNSPIEMSKPFVYEVNVDGLNITDEGDAPTGNTMASGIQRVEYVLHGNMTGSGTNKIVINDGFKGYIEIKAYDNVGNSTTTYSRNIICTSENKSNGKISVVETTLRDKGNNPLYADKTSAEINVTDSFAYIQKVEYSVEAPNDINANVNRTTLYTAKGNMESSYNGNIIVDTNSNDTLITVYVTDQCGNEKKYTKLISIDKTAPVVEMSFDNNNFEGSGRFKESRTATIIIKERNFDPSKVQIDISSNNGMSPSISGWNYWHDATDPDNDAYVTTVAFNQDGEYAIGVSCRDKAENVGNGIPRQSFTIDKNAPSINVSFDNNNSLNGNYFASGRTATITVNEHYFDANRVVIEGVATNDGKTIAFPGISGWTDNGDIHSATIRFANDGDYSFKVRATDQAGNTSPDYVVSDFIIDQVAPVITFGGVEDNAAYNDVVEPTVSFEDINYDVDNVNITLVGANRGAVNYANGASGSNNGQTFSYSDFAHEEDVDDIYTLTANITDKAGNNYEDSITFSVNRFGSNYVLDDTLKNINGKYIKSAIDIIFTETNVNTLNEASSTIVVSVNGNPKTLVRGTDYTVAEAGGNGSWSQYRYTINKSVFDGDGTYIVSVYSEDIAGNINENDAEDKDAEITFGIDGTEPSVILTNLENGGDYNSTNYEAIVNISDNLILDSVEVLLDGEKIEAKQAGEDYSFDIPESNEKQNITIIAKDAAGNKVSTEVTGVLVSTNALVRFMGNTPAVVGTVASLVIVAGCGVFVVANGGFAGAASAVNAKFKVRKKK